MEVLLVSSLGVLGSLGGLPFSKTTGVILSILILFFLFPVTFGCSQFGVAQMVDGVSVNPSYVCSLSSASVPQAVPVTLIGLVQ